MKITPSKTFQTLVQLQQQLQAISLGEMLAQKSLCDIKQLHIEAAGLCLDYSRNRINEAVIAQLLELASAHRLPERIEAQFSGQAINLSESRAVLHTALRSQDTTPLLVQDVNVRPVIADTLARMAEFTEAVRAGRSVGASGEPITDVINIGIGGSDLGPAFVTEALAQYCDGPRVHFFSTFAADDIQRTLQRLDRKRTLLVVVSKTFTTAETLANARVVMQWLGSAAIAQQVVAVTAQPERALALGVGADHVFPLWDWVGGRFSLWSAVGLVIALAVGMDNFLALLAGANAMDQHFRQAPLAGNMPVLLALLGVWYANFWQAPTQAVIAYSPRLRNLAQFLQQNHMESLGKRVDLNGDEVDYATGPILWGGAGTDTQHSFHQLLMQSPHWLPIDFVLPLRHGVDTPLNEELIAHCLAQSQTLALGYDPVADPLRAHKMIPGNVPSNLILLPDLTPRSLGALLALYEHKIFVQSVIWEINAYDQWGVERGKQVAEQLLKDIQQGTVHDAYDSATKAVLMRCFKLRERHETAR